MRKPILALLTMSAVSALSANAATIIFDNQSRNPGGTFTFGTSSGVATLTNGVIDQVTKINGVVQSSAVTGGCGAALSLGCLNFTTGAFSSSSTAGNTTTYVYNGGGSLAVTGNATLAPLSGPTLFTTNALTPGFTGLVSLSYNTATGLASLSGTLNPGTLDPALATFFTVGTATPGGTDSNSAINITFSGLNNTGTGSGMATTNSVQVTASAVPEPASMGLIGAGLLTLGLMRKTLVKRS